MATCIPPMYATYIPASGGLSATTITQIMIGVMITAVPIVICCIRISTWVSSKLCHQPREEDVVEEAVFDDIGHAMCIRRQKSEVNVPTYNEVRLEYRKGRWMEVQPLAAGFRMVIPKESARFNLSSLEPPRRAMGTPRISLLFPSLPPSSPSHFHHEPNSPTLTPSFLDISIVVRMPQPQSQSPALKDHIASPNLHRDDLMIATMSSPLITTYVEAV